MDFDEFINTTQQHDTFDIIDTNTNGTCCYDSILRLLKLNKRVKKNMNTRTIQSQAVNWIIINKYFYLCEYDLTIEDFVLLTHNLSSFQEYIDTYKIYSGKSDYTITNNRWGGTPELIALSYIYNININVYTGNSYDKNKNKIIKGTIVYNKPRKDFRFKLLLNTNNNLEDSSGEKNSTNIDNSFNILYTRYKNNSSHFDALLKKK
tara:strand:- start:1129 stop:1746 length:618 start_codon:yes stop_codon:yes gene_type:complete